MCHLDQNRRGNMKKPVSAEAVGRTIDGGQEARVEILVRMLLHLVQPRILSLPLLFLLATVRTFAADDTVKIESGLVAGSGAEIRVFKGIPYAAPPTGDLRWKPPSPRSPGRACARRPSLVRRVCKSSTIRKSTRIV